MGAPYRSYEVDGRKLEPDPSARRKVRLAGLTTAALGVGIGATAPMLGPLAAVFGGGLALLGLALYREAPHNPMKAPCPECTAEIGDIDPLAEAVRCPSCGDYARPGGGVLVAMDDHFVAREPTFAIPIGRGAPPDLPPICAECGRAGVSHAVRVPVNVAGIALDADSAFRVVLMPHCLEHSRGAAAELGAVRVRSRALWLAATAPGD